MKRLSFVAQVAGILCLLSLSVYAADFSPTLLKLSAPPIVQYNFTGQSLEIPVQVSGTPAGIIFTVYTRGKSDQIPNIKNGYLGWHQVNKVDTCIYYSPLKSVGIGQTTITWNGRNQDGGVVPAGEYTYYLWAYDNVSTKVKMTEFMRPYSSVYQVMEVDPNGLPLAKPIYYHTTQRWYVGNDPNDQSLLETTRNVMPTGWAIRNINAMDPNNFEYYYMQLHNTDTRQSGLTKWKFVPNGDAEMQANFGNGGYSDLFSAPSGDKPGVVAGADYLYTGDQNHVGSAEPDTQFYIYDYNGVMIAEIDLTPWWSSADALSKGAQMNGGPNELWIRHEKVFLNCHCSCIKQMVDPVRYLDTRNYNDFYVWTNQNGDYVLDHNFEETAALPWVCNDYNVGPYNYNISADDNLWSQCPAYDVGAVSFGLMGPDGTGIGYFAFAGETAGWKKGSFFIDGGTAYDGLYCDNEHTGGSHYEWNASLRGLGCYFIGHDSITGIISTTAGPYLSLNTPRGGERYERGSTCRISWTAFDIGYLKVEFSTNSGSTWTTIADRTAASAGSLDWRVPSIVSDHCFIRITDVSNASRTDRNDTAFSMVMPSNVQEYYVVDMENTGSNASVIIQADHVPRINGVTIEVGDCIGIFTPRGLCAGALVWGGINSVITVWGDDPLVDGIRGFAAGEQMTFKIWDSSENKEYVVNATYSQGSNVFAADGFYAVNTLENQSIQFNVSLNSGWNLISLPLMVSNWSMESVLSSIQARVVAVKNGAGNIYWPAYQINTIGEWNKLHGYQVYVNAPCTMTLSGYELFVPGIEYTLNRGWNLISYLGTNGASPAAVFGSILNDVVMVKNNAGRVFWPEYSVDDIVRMYRGQAYWINLASPVTFRYQTGSAKPLAVAADDGQQTVHFTPVESTGSNATILITADSFTADGITLNEGDEIGIFTPSGICVGATLYRPGMNMAVPVWGDDSMTDEIEGLAQGEAFRILLWDSEPNREISTMHQKAFFDHNAIIILRNLSVEDNNATDPSIEPLSYALSQNTPNPFNPETVIPFTIPRETNVTITIYDVSGRSVDVIADHIFPAGSHSIIWNAANHASGLYFCRMRAGSFAKTVKMTVIK